MSTPLSPMQSQDNNDRSQMTSELKSHEASKTVADENTLQKLQRESEELKRTSPQELEEKSSLDPKNEEGRKHHQSKQKHTKPSTDDTRSPKAKKYMGGQFFDGFA